MESGNNWQYYKYLNMKQNYVWASRPPEEMKRAWHTWQSKGECDSCGNTSVDIRRMANPKEGHSMYNPYAGRYFYKFTCSKCKYTWIPLKESNTILT